MLVYRHDLNTFVIFPLFRDQEQINLLRQQLEESTKVSENLRRELNVYEKLYKLSVQGRNREVQTEGMFVVLFVLKRATSCFLPLASLSSVIYVNLLYLKSISCFPMPKTTCRGRLCRVTIFRFAL